jgi:hypothetical protein
MGPQFPLQRITVTLSGYITDPVRSFPADRQTRHPKDTARVVCERRTIPLITESIYEPGECPEQE